jgi:hypothetical protein
MDYKKIADGVVNGIYSHSTIAMAAYVLETLAVPQKTIDEIEAELYAEWDARKHRGAA